MKQNNLSNGYIYKKKYTKIIKSVGLEKDIIYNLKMVGYLDKYSIWIMVYIFINL